MRNQSQSRLHEAKPTNSNRRKIIVIADDGVEASVVLLDAVALPGAGSLFEYRDRQWVIRGQRHHSRVLVAEPVARAQQTQAKKRGVRTQTCCLPNP